MDMGLEGPLIVMAILLLCASLFIVLLLVITTFNQRQTAEWYLRQRCGNCRVMYLAERVLNPDSSFDEFVELFNLVMPDAAANPG